MLYLNQISLEHNVIEVLFRVKKYTSNERLLVEIGSLDDSFFQNEIIFYI